MNARIGNGRAGPLRAPGSLRTAPGRSTGRPLICAFAVTNPEARPSSCCNLGNGHVYTRTSPGFGPFSRRQWAVHAGAAGTMGGGCCAQPIAEPPRVPLHCRHWHGISCKRRSTGLERAPGPVFRALGHRGCGMAGAACAHPCARVGDDGDARDDHRHAERRNRGHSRRSRRRGLAWLRQRQGNAT